MRHFDHCFKLITQLFNRTFTKTNTFYSPRGFKVQKFHFISKSNSFKKSEFHYWINTTISIIDVKKEIKGLHRGIPRNLTVLDNRYLCREYFFTRKLIKKFFALSKELFSCSRERVALKIEIINPPCYKSYKWIFIL